MVRFVAGFDCEECRRNFNGDISYYVCENDHNAFCCSCASKIKHRCSRCDSNLSYLS